MSSDNYAGRLSEYPNKGICGLPEGIDSRRTIDYKIAKLIKLMKEAKHIVVLSGAGISTSAGIPDFRGPKGIWTTEENDKKKRKKANRKSKRKGLSKEASQNSKKCIGDNDDDDNTACVSTSVSTSTSTPASAENDISTDKERTTACEKIDSKNSDPLPNVRKRTRDDTNTTSKENNHSNNNNTSTQEASAEISTSSTSELSFENAIPTLTHKAITRLAEMEIIDYVITQNVDGLHRRSGLPRSKHAVLHGCIFTEKCERCGMEYFRDYDVGGVSFQKTGRKCTKSTSDGICDGDLRDTILDWEDELPEMDWAMSQEQACKADLVLAIGTSLRIEPAGSLPTFGRKFVIINKQVTPYDNRAALIIRANVDDIFSRIMEELDKDESEDSSD